MSYAIYRINTDQYFEGFSRQGVPEWTSKKDKALKFPDMSSAILEADSLSDDFRFAVEVQAIKLDLGR
jgi:hypothetical protein